MYRSLRLLLPLLIISTGGIAGLAAAQDAPTEIVAVSQVAPYTRRDADGRWSGPAIDLMRTAADRAGVTVRFVDRKPGQFDASAGAMAIATLPVIAAPERPQGTVQSLPLADDGVGLLGAQSGGSFLGSLLKLFNLGFAKVVMFVAGLLLVVGAVFWLAERAGNEDMQSDGKPLSGIGKGFWWAGVTATTIGYGDTVPKTLGGRSVAMIWMLFSMALTAILTAYIVSLTGKGAGNADLSETIAGERVGVVEGSYIPKTLLNNAAELKNYRGLSAARRALEQGEIDLVAYPYRAAKSAANKAEVTRANAGALMPVVIIREDAVALQREIDRIILSQDWQARMDQGK